MKMKYTSRADLLIAAGKSIKMQEKAGIEPVVKHSGMLEKASFWNYNSLQYDYEFPLSVVEGKPVFVGDKLFNPRGDMITMHEGIPTTAKDGGIFDLSWNPPKPKTVMVELSFIAAENYARTNIDFYDSKNTHSDLVTVVKACRKALEQK